MCTIQEQSSRKSSMEGFLKKNRFFARRKGGGNADSCELCWLIFWFHNVNLCKISFLLIGRTLYFCKELKFLFFGSPLQKSNGGSKYENFISVLNHILWPIKWKEILHRITIWNKKMSHYNSQESALPQPFLKVKNRFFSKSAPGKISLSIVLVLYTHEIGKTARKSRVMSFLPWIGCQTVVHCMLLEKASNWY